MYFRFFLVVVLYSLLRNRLFEILIYCSFILGYITNIELEGLSNQLVVKRLVDRKDTSHTPLESVLEGQYESLKINDNKYV